MPITRHGTPQSHSTSRPSSRNHRRVSSNLAPHGHGTPPPPGSQNGFAYMSNPSLYNPNVHSAMNQHRPGQYPQYGPPPGSQGTPPQTLHHGLPPHGLPPHQGPQQFQNPAVASQHMGMVQGSHPPVYMTAAGRLPAFTSNSSDQERTVSGREDSQENASGNLKAEHGQSPPHPNAFSKSRSIFTPIDDRGSVLARHFGAGASIYESPRGNQAVKVEAHEESTETRPASSSATEPTRTQSMSSAPELKPPMRTNSGPLPSKRPQLKVQIPSENSDRGSATAESSSRDSAGNKTATPAKDNPPTGVVLPPPSPSAGAILSAGAQGPPNPFARPPPPGASQGSSYGNNGGTSNNTSTNNSNNIETPISALPSRFVSDALLPSPSSFFPEWGFGRSGPDSNLLPSPLTFPTPAIQSGPSFSREDEQDKKRKSPDSGGSSEGASKKPKT